MASLLRSWAVTRRIWQQLRNDKRTIGLIVIFPVIFSLFFGYAFSGEVIDLNVAFIDNDESYMGIDFSNAIIENLLNDSRLFLENQTGISFEQAEQLVLTGVYRAVIYFPTNFTKHLILAEDVNVTIYIDGSEPSGASAILDSIHDAFETELREQRGLGFEFTYLYGGPDVRQIDFIAPAIIPFVMTTVLLMLTAVFVVRERLNGTLSRMLSTQATKLDILLGFAQAISVIGIIQSTIILLLTILIFNVTVQGSLLFAYLFIILFSLVPLSMGLLVSVWANNELQALQFIPLLIFPSLLLSGFFVPIDLLPFWLQPFAYGFPLTYGIHGLREIMVRGSGFEAVWPDVLALLIMIIIFIGLAVKLFREE